MNIRKFLAVILALTFALCSFSVMAEETVSVPEEEASVETDALAASADEQPSVDPKATPRIGIISAMSSEKKYLLEQSEIEETVVYGNMEYHIGTLCGKDVVITSAGVGKSFAAAGAALMLDNFNITEVIFTGIAGGVGDATKVLDIVISTDLVMHDYGDQTNDGFVWDASWTEDGYIPADTALCAKTYAAALGVVGKENVHLGTIATGDQFIASEIYVAELQNKFNAIACEMEGCAVALICHNNDVPFVVIRAMSDKADGKANSSIENFGATAADNSGKIVCALLDLL